MDIHYFYRCFRYLSLPIFRLLLARRPRPHSQYSPKARPKIKTNPAAPRTVSHDADLCPPPAASCTHVSSAAAPAAHARHRSAYVERAFMCGAAATAACYNYATSFCGEGDDRRKKKISSITVCSDKSYQFPLIRTERKRRRCFR